MGTITGTMRPLGTSKMNQEFHTCTKNKKTINEIHKLRNNKKNIKELGTKIKDLNRDLGSRGTVLGK